MTMMSRIVAASLFAAAVGVTAPAQATQIPDGTVSVSIAFAPSVTLGSTSTFSASNGLTFDFAANGGFAGAQGGLGNLNGLLSFSSTVGTVLDQTVANFFNFSDGSGHQFHFSVSSVQTLGYSIVGNSKSFSLYLLGDTVDADAGYESTPTSLTLGFNSTGNSAYSSSATLAVPPAPIPTVPEPATWALTLVGFGAMGAALRRRPRVRSVTFA